MSHSAIELERARLLESLARRQQELDLNASLTRQSPSPDADMPSQGTLRTREEMEADNGPPSFLQHGFLVGPYTPEESRAFKRTKNLSAQADADAEAFIKAAHPMRQAYHTHIAVLECRDKLTVIWADQSARFRVSDTLQKTCTDWAHVAVLSATATCYRDKGVGPSIAASIMTVMRTLSIAELPPTKETGRCEAVRAVITTGLTNYRCHVKTCIFKALKQLAQEASSPSEGDQSNDGVVDIATLARSCIGNAPTQPTARLYQRIAFIRLCARECKETKTSDVKFWKAVDTKLTLYREVARSKEDLQTLYNDNYENDKKLYGAPDAGIPTVMMQDVEEWLTTLEAAV
ncbi:hypothetical protein FB451DRAFT_1550968 [Mycena latifolia]|nr:hypothetical protein FB451DRAFT_1560502 [Mycena latifolia]KAJ7493480.1 hypothetical protein FB451DRAFT_1550968 [Mycena latifolia]